MYVETQVQGSPLDDDAIIGERVLLTLVPYCSMQIRRLEKAGKFPRRVHLAGGKRVGWVMGEVRQHNRALAAARATKRTQPEAA